jgi:hypothetical protein
MPADPGESGSWFANGDSSNSGAGDLSLEPMTSRKRRLWVPAFVGLIVVGAAIGTIAYVRTHADTSHPVRSATLPAVDVVASTPSPLGGPASQQTGPSVPSPQAQPQGPAPSPSPNPSPSPVVVPAVQVPPANPPTVTLPNLPTNPPDPDAPTLPLPVNPPTNPGLNPPTAVPSANSEQADLMVKQGRAALFNNDLITAASFFNKAASLDPEDSDALGGLGEVALAEGQYDAAAEHFHAALKLDPQNSRDFAKLGESELKNGNPQGALADCQQALQIESDLQDAAVCVSDAQAALSGPGAPPAPNPSP